MFLHVACTHFLDHLASHIGFGWPIGCLLSGDLALVMFLNRSAEDHETNRYVLEEIRMYALAIVRYRLPIEEVDESFREAHRDYLRGLKKQGLLIASGPFKPHFGGAFLLRVPDTNAAETLDQIRDGDPFTTHKFAQYELLAWDVKTGIEDLDKI